MSTATVRSIRQTAEKQARLGPEVPVASDWSPLDYKERGPVSILTRISPDLAYKMLEQNTHNRTVSDTHVRRLATDMGAERWIVTHQGIAFGADGVLLDGQHRLFAVTEAKCDVEMMVSYNVDPNSLKVIDIGKARTVGQTWDLVSGTKSGRLIVSRASVIRQLEARKGQVPKFLYEDAQEVYGRHVDGLTWSLKVMPGTKGGQSAPVSGAIAFAYPASPDKMNTFAAQVISGEMITRSDPAYSLRRIIAENSSGGFAGSEIRWLLALATIRAAYAFVKGEQLSVIKRGMLVASTAEKEPLIEEALKFFVRHHKRKPAA